MFCTLCFPSYAEEAKRRKRGKDKERGKEYGWVEQMMVTMRNLHIDFIEGMENGEREERLKDQNLGDLQKKEKGIGKKKKKWKKKKELGRDSD